MKFGDEAIKGIKESMVIWKKREKGLFVDADCPLCLIYKGENEDDKWPCEGCPIEQRTGDVHCYNTNYYKWAAYEDRSCEGARKEACIMLGFLGGLLKK